MPQPVSRKSHLTFCAKISMLGRDLLHLYVGYRSYYRFSLRPHMSVPNIISLHILLQVVQERRSASS